MYGFNKARGVTTSGGSFNGMTKLAVWSKAKPALGYSPDVVRRDCCGALIAWGAYGQTTAYGWEIDHITPVAAGGSDALSNLQPLHWENNRAKADKPPGEWSCAVTRSW